MVQILDIILSDALSRYHDSLVMCENDMQFDGNHPSGVEGATTQGD